MSVTRSVGIIGAGKLGIILAQLSLRAGHQVRISGSGDPEKIALSVEMLAPGAVATTNNGVVAGSDVVILAMPLKNFHQLDLEMFKGKLVVDAMNYWWETDGDLDDILPKNMTQSEAVQDYLSGARVVKGLNHMGYHNLLDAVDDASELGRKAIAIAGDRSDDVAEVSGFVASLGLDPLPIGDLSEGRLLEPGQPAFGANVDLAALRKLVS